MRKETQELIRGMQGGLIVSVQQDIGSPLDRPEIIAAMAQAVALPGVAGLRLNEPKNIQAVRSVVDLPILGIYKKFDLDGRVWITPTFDLACLLVEAGSDLIAVDATSRPRPPKETVPELIRRIHSELGTGVMADIAYFEEGLMAAEAGADLVSTTLSGYTRPPFASLYDPPDLGLVQRLVATLSIPVVAEGRYNNPELARRALLAGAHAVVIGSAITRPDLITKIFLHALTGKQA